VIALPQSEKLAAGCGTQSGRLRPLGGKRRPISYPTQDRCLGSLSASPASANDRTTRRTAETTGAAKLAIPCSPSFNHTGCSFQILLISSEPGEGLQWAKEYWACAKRTPFTGQPTLLCPTSAGSNLCLFTTGEKAKTFSHPSLRAYETHCRTAGSANQPRSFPS
jgi:hypothetical protein